jgi:hypothetical protein
MSQKKHPGRRINQIRRGKAYENSATVENAKHGFRKCEILPFNRYLFTDLDFAPSEVHLMAPVNKVDGEI